MARRTKIAPSDVRIISFSSAEAIAQSIDDEIANINGSSKHKKNIRPPGFSSIYSMSQCIAEIRIISHLFIQALEYEIIDREIQNPALLKATVFLNSSTSAVAHVLRKKLLANAKDAELSDTLNSIDTFITLLPILQDSLQQVQGYPPNHQTDSDLVNHAIAQIDFLHQTVFGTKIVVSKETDGEKVKSSFGIRLVQKIMRETGLEPYSPITIARRLWSIRS
jgi:hypothetical protein